MAGPVAGPDGESGARALSPDDHLHGLHFRTPGAFDLAAHPGVVASPSRRFGEELGRIAGSTA